MLNVPFNLYDMKGKIAGSALMFTYRYDNLWYYFQDAAEFVDKRVKKLLKEGIVTALVALTKTDSHNSRELLARYVGRGWNKTTF